MYWEFLDDVKMTTTIVTFTTINSKITLIKYRQSDFYARK